MNSITKHISPASIVAALRQFRSARKDIILVVEGDDDIALFSQSLGLASNCFISCFGKENLMKVFGLVPNEHVDIGMFFIRDADFDGLKHQRSEGVCFFVSDRYDFEMNVVEGRIFHRIFAEFLKKKDDHYSSRLCIHTSSGCRRLAWSAKIIFAARPPKS